MHAPLAEPGRTARPNRLATCGCPRCGSSRSAVVLSAPDRQFPTDEQFAVSRCAECGLRFQNPRVPPEHLADYYPPEYAAYTASEIVTHDSLRWHLKNRLGYDHLACDVQPTARQMAEGRATSLLLLLPRFVPGGRVLEIGCAAGDRLELLRQLGWQSCLGSELSAGAAAQARSRGFQVTEGSIDAALHDIADRSLSAIVAGFVWEHLTDPFVLTRQLAAKLAPGGQLLLSTINVVCPDFWLYGPHWYNLDLPRHMVFFRKSDLRAMLRDDFHVETIATESALNDYVGSARYRLRDGAQGWRHTLDTTLVRLGPRLRRPLNYIARAGLGGRIYMAARKK